MNKAFEKILERLEERTSFLSDCPKSGNKDAKQQNKSSSTMMMYEVADLVDDLIEIVKQEAEQYNNGWIPVSDHIHMPAKKSFGNKQKRTNVLVTLRNGLVKEMTFEFETNEFWEAGDDNHIEHWKEDVIDTDVEVIAWQPLPKPFQNGE